MPEEPYSCSHLNQIKMIKSEEIMVNSHRLSLATARPLAYQVLRDGRAREADVMAPYSVLRYRIDGLGTGDTSQIAGAQGGRGGVGISSPLPCLEGEQLGSVAGAQLIQLPGKGSTLGERPGEPLVDGFSQATDLCSLALLQPQ